jgi:exopolyphosphatase/guanosine-5'-triphosphate,3'-diphosphate pyrophosphatase
MLESSPTNTIGAIDLGSNSFHLVIARVSEHGFTIVDREKEAVRLAAGLDEHGNLTEDASERAIRCLARFGERVRELPTDCVRVVGTNTLRKARNALPFLIRASATLGHHRIEVVSGREEARLIYQGVSHDFDSPGRRLVVDVGGGSTELIVGQDREPLSLDSLYMGCVSWSMRYFGDGRYTEDKLNRAITAAEVELETVAARYRAQDWDHALGASGTCNAIERVLLETGLSPDGITATGLQSLRNAIVEAGSMQSLSLPGLSDIRREVFVGGVAILSAVFRSLELEKMTAVGSALREGLLVELIGRLVHKDIREATIHRLAADLGIEPLQAERVENTALMLFDQVATQWELHPESDRTMLRWAATLHEAGIFISYSGHHKHGSYLLQHADLPGFSRQDQRVLATLVLSHRGRIRLEQLSAVATSRFDALLRTILLLRLAARLHRGRSDSMSPNIKTHVSENSIQLLFPPGWLDSVPLTRADLTAESHAFATAGYALTFT